MAVQTPLQSLKYVGSYEILKKLGEGAMGWVYKGRHRTNNELVAIKVVKSEWVADEILVRRFEQEYEVARTLQHPNIVRALDYGMVNGSPYLVLEFVEGESLGDRLERDGRLAEAEAVPIIAQVAEALHLAHQHNLIHRDVKPDNILLSKTGHAKLTDLGLVKNVDLDLQLTQTGSAMGTPNFGAPEQFDNAKDVDARTDVYSLGATLYMMLTGEVPFRGGRLNQFMQIIKKKLTDDLPPPRQLVPEVSEAVDRAVCRAVRADRRQRFASCPEFVAALTAPSQPAPAPAPRRATGAERRAAVRFACDLASSCQPVGRLKDKDWAVKIQDISASGACLLVRRRFEPGAVLLLKLHGKEESLTRTFLLRVVRVQAQSSRSWALGCVFDRPLSDIEMKLLV